MFRPVLGITREASKQEVRKAYHAQARLHHPDKKRASEDKAKANEYFQLINAAYEYMGQHTSYNQALTYLTRDPRHRAKARELALSEGLLSTRRKENGRKLTKEEAKSREEEALRKVVIETFDLRGDFSPPSIRKTLLFRIILLPLTVGQWLGWAFRWVWLYWIMRQPYDDEAQIYLTCRRLGLSRDQWDGMPERQAALLAKQLWLADKFKVDPSGRQSTERVNLLLGVCGSVAAIKAPELVTGLLASNFNVRTVLTESALQFVSRDQFTVDLFTDKDECWTRRGDPVLHIELRDWATLLLIAPMSANTLAKVANGLCDNLLTSLIRAWWYPEGDKKAYFAPAMNTGMWMHPFTVKQTTCLTNELGWIQIPPIEKRLMCGSHGVGAMAEPSDIIEVICTDFMRK